MNDIIITARQAKTHNGTSRNVFEHIQSLKALNYQPLLLAEKANSHKLAQHKTRWIQISRFPLRIKGINRHWFDFRVQRWCQKNKPRLVISHGDTLTRGCLFMHNCTALAAEKLGEDTQTSKNVAFHDYILKNAQPQCLVANSSLMANDLITRYHYPPHKVSVIYPSYNPQQFNIDNARRKRQATRAYLGIDPHQTLVGLITSGAYKKRNIDGFIEIAAGLKKQYPHKSWQFLLVGQDSLQPYQAKIDQYQLTDCWLHLPPQPDVETLYGALDLFILPARFEEFGRVALEAMACGTPTLLSDQVGASELLQSRYADLILPLESHKWIDKINNMVQDTNLSRLGEQLSQLAQHYDAYAQHKQHLQLFTNLLKADNPT